MINQFAKEFVTEECCNCGVIFAVSQQLQRNWLRTKQTFYCPNGHGQSYTKSTADLLQEKLDGKDREIGALKHELDLATRKPKRRKATKRV